MMRTNNLIHLFIRFLAVALVLVTALVTKILAADSSAAAWFEASGTSDPSIPSELLSPTVEVVVFHERFDDKPTVEWSAGLLINRHVWPGRQIKEFTRITRESPGEDETPTGTSLPLPLLEKINHPRVGLTLHLPQEIKGGNARRFPEIIAKVKDYIKLVVICGADLPKEDDNPLRWNWDRLMRPLGEGDFNVATFVREVKATGYQGYFAQICWGIQKPALPYLTTSMAEWKSYQ